MHRIGRICRRHIIMNAWALVAAGCSWAAGAIRPIAGDATISRLCRSSRSLRKSWRSCGRRSSRRTTRSATEAKLKKLTVNRKLMAAAQAHAEDMAGRRKMTHTGGDGSSSSERIKARGYRYFRTGENVAVGRFSVDRAHERLDGQPSPQAEHPRRLLRDRSGLRRRRRRQTLLVRHVRTPFLPLIADPTAIPSGMVDHRRRAPSVDDVPGRAPIVEEEGQCHAWESLGH